MGFLVATDLDGTFGRKVFPTPPGPPTLCISGRTFSEYDQEAKDIAQQMPLYIRGTGTPKDTIPSAYFKATMILQLGVTHFLENTPAQAAIIRKCCPNVQVLMVVDTEKPEKICF